MDILKKFRVEETTADGNLTKNQKLAVLGLAVLGIVILVFWAVGMKNNIYLPFESSTDKIGDSGSCPNGDCSAADTKDTDGDGLTDWEESNVYQTSPYIEDSDSDGVKDGDEVKAGGDPNCPRGQNCGQDLSADTATSASGEIVPGSYSLNQEQVIENESELNKAFSGQADAKTLRKLLSESGIPQNVLDQMTDEQLMASYAETLRQVSGE